MAEKQKQLQQIMDLIDENYIAYDGETSKTIIQIIKSGKVDFNKFSFESYDDDAKKTDAKETLQALLQAYSVEDVKDVKDVKDVEDVEDVDMLNDIMSYIKTNKMVYKNPEELKGKALYGTIAQGRIDFDLTKFHILDEDGYDIDTIENYRNKLKTLITKYTERKKFYETMKADDLDDFIFIMWTLRDILVVTEIAKKELSDSNTWDENDMIIEQNELENTLIAKIHDKQPDMTKEDVEDKVASILSGSPLPTSLKTFKEDFDDIIKLKDALALRNVITEVNEAFNKNVPEGGNLNEINEEEILGLAQLRKVDKVDASYIKKLMQKLKGLTLDELFESLPDKTLSDQLNVPEVQVYLELKYVQFRKFIDAEIKIATFVYDEKGEDKEEDEDEENLIINHKTALENEQEQRERMGKRKREGLSNEKLFFSGTEEPANIPNLDSQIAAASKEHAALQVQKFEEEFDLFLKSNPSVKEIREKFPYVEMMRVYYKQSEIPYNTLFNFLAHDTTLKDEDRVDKVKAKLEELERAAAATRAAAAAAAAAAALKKPRRVAVTTTTTSAQ